MQGERPPGEPAPGEGSGWLPPEPPGGRPETQPTAPAPTGPPPPPTPQAPQYQQPAPTQPGQPHQFQQPAPAQPQYGWQPGAPVRAEPDNGEAVAGFVLGIVSLALLLVSFGLSSVISLTASVLGVIFGRRGQRKVDRGDTRKHRGLAQAGFITGIVGIVLSILATVAWTALLLDEDFRRELEESNSTSLVLVGVALGIRLVAS